MASKTVAFFGASTGIGLSALKHTLAAGHQCIALCRVPSKLTDILLSSSNPNLQVVQGNAHDVAAVSQCLKKQDGNLVDAIVSTIGGKPVLSKLSIDDPHVCEKGIDTLLEALALLRRDGATGRPLLVIGSSTGISRAGRDIPLAMVPLYHVGLKVPHQDKKILEARVLASDEDYTIIRPSFLTDGETNTEIRVGVEDPKTGHESKAIGYTISREDAGKWVADVLLIKGDTKYLKKLVTITY
ncbi:hypothetical protein B0T10DRAFT_500195 [Thelonectria olida]|uniref:NAD(P)-binding domain-containing protein n=1 Tax=Thelonectria olida TaxID=1576542 RepID=A0A9P8VRT4_9HYPO|nr:hypothetical protein B0T10DRAFT_500195 [Thelonectria olida]